MKKWLLALLFAGLLTLAACGGDDGGTDEPTDAPDEEPATEEPADEGAEGDDAGESVDTAAADEIYQANCAMCHGADLAGGAGPDLTEAGASFTAEEIETIIHEGTGSMAPVNMADEDAATVAAWLAEQE